MGLVFWRWGIDPHHHWLTLTASGPTPTAGMTLSRLLIHLGTMATDGQCLSAVPLIRRHKSDATMAVPMVVPLHKCRYPCAGFLHALEGPAGVIRPVFHCAEQRFRKGVVVAHPGPGEGSEHPQLLQPAFQGGRSHGIAVIGMEDQGMGTALTDPLPQAGPAHKICSDLGVFPIGHILRLQTSITR